MAALSAAVRVTGRSAFWGLILLLSFSCGAVAHKLIFGGKAHVVTAKTRWVEPAKR